MDILKAAKSITKTNDTLSWRIHSGINVQETTQEMKIPMTELCLQINI